MIHWRTQNQIKVRQQIEQEFAANNIAHTMLISGFDSVTCLEFAKDLAMLIGCENKNICGECKFCTRFLAGSNTDCFVYSNDEATKLGIEEVRILKQNLTLSTEANARIVIIQNVERLSIPCLNALLKILEEPPSKVYFVLTAQNYKEVLPTIVSRSRIYLMENKHINNGTEEWVKKISNVKSRTDGLMLAEEMSKETDENLKIFFLSFIDFLKNNAEYGFLEEVQKSYNLINQNVNSRIALEVLFLRYIDKCSIV